MKRLEEIVSEPKKTIKGYKLFRKKEDKINLIVRC